MKISLIKKIIPIAALLAAGAMFFAIETEVRAQTGDCEVTQAVLRTTRPVSLDDFYTENNRPYLYVDITTQNCINETIKISVVEDNDFGDASFWDDVDGIPGFASDPYEVDNEVVSVVEDEFTIALITGDDECTMHTLPGVPDCTYHVETFDETSTAVQLIGDIWQGSPLLKYECPSGCDNTPWTYLGPIQFEATHEDDPDAPGNNSNTQVTTQINFEVIGGPYTVSGAANTIAVFNQNPADLQTGDYAVVVFDTASHTTGSNPFGNQLDYSAYGIAFEPTNYPYTPDSNVVQVPTSASLQTNNGTTSSSVTGQLDITSLPTGVNYSDLSYIVLVRGQDIVTTNNSGSGGSSGLPDQSASGDISILNPLSDPDNGVDSVQTLFGRIVELIVSIGVPIVAMAIVYSGLLFVTARGKEDQITKAKSAFTFAIIGGIVLLTAFLIAEAIKDALQNLAIIFNHFV